jgi:hypothetical protein
VESEPKRSQVTCPSERGRQRSQTEFSCWYATTHRCAPGPGVLTVLVGESNHQSVSLALPPLQQRAFVSTNQLKGPTQEPCSRHVAEQGPGREREWGLVTATSPALSRRFLVRAPARVLGPKKTRFVPPKFRFAPHPLASVSEANRAGVQGRAQPNEKGRTTGPVCTACFTKSTARECTHSERERERE